MCVCVARAPPPTARRDVMDEANNLQALVHELPAPGVVAVPVVPNGQQVELLPRLQRAGGRTKKRCWMYMAEKCGDQEADQIRGRRMQSDQHQLHSGPAAGAAYLGACRSRGARRPGSSSARAPKTAS